MSVPSITLVVMHACIPNLPTIICKRCGISMTQNKPAPGISREKRLSDEGLRRLERQLLSGAKMSKQVLAQWIKRYGEPAREIIVKHGHYKPELDPD